MLDGVVRFIALRHPLFPSEYYQTSADLQGRQKISVERNFDGALNRQKLSHVVEYNYTYILSVQINIVIHILN